METGERSRFSLSRKRKKGSEIGFSGSFVHSPTKSELACQIEEENTESVSNSTSSCEKNPEAAIILERREENSSETKKSITAWLTKSHKPRTVSCPVCDKLVLLSTINRHLDSNCESDTSGKSQEDSNQNSRSSKVNGAQKCDKENAVWLPSNLVSNYASKKNVMESKECKVDGRLTQTNESLIPSKDMLSNGNGFNVDIPCANVRTRGEHRNESIKHLKNDDHSSFQEIFEGDFHGSLTDTTKELSSKGKTAKSVIADEESELEEKNMLTTPGLQDLSKDATNSDKSKDDNEEHEEKKLETQVGELQNNYEPYYLANFKLVLSNVMSNEDDRQLFNEQDNEVIDQFNAMSPEEQKLYIRLFQRKRGWFRCAKLDYPKICKDLKPVTDLLIGKGFLQDENQLINLQEALYLIAAPELKLLVKSLHISAGKKGGTKEELIETIVNLAENQKTIFGSFRSVVLKRTRQVLGSCVRVAPFPREVFNRVLLLFTMNVIPDDEDTTNNGQAQQLSTLFLANIGKIVYPSYLIDRPTPVLHSRESLIAFTDAFQQKHEMYMALESNNFELAYGFYPEACKKFNEVLIKLKDNQQEQAVAAAHLPEHLRCFSAEWAITKMCYFGVEVMQKWRQYEGAVDQLEKLLEQDVFCFESRGRWYDRLALNLHQHLKRPEKALEVIRQGLSDRHVRFGRRLALVQRAKRILSSPAFQKGKKKKCEDFLDLDLKEPSPCKCITISGTRCAELGVFIAPEISQDGVVNHDTKTFCAVEEYALSYYRQHGFDQGIHGEGSTFSSLFCLFMWDIIFTSGIPDVFRSPFQAAPLDMCFDSFYANRKEISDRRLEEIMRASVQKLQEMLLASWNSNYGLVCAGLSWERFRDVEQAKQLVACLGGAVLSGIFTRFVQGYRYFRSGLPDLVVWNSSSLDYRIAEVKGPGDKLSTKQQIWLEVLESLGANVEVCYVTDIGAKRLRISN